MSNKSIAFSFMPNIGSSTLCIFVALDEPHKPEDWAAFIEALKKALRSTFRTLVLTDGGSPSPAQRKQMIDLCQAMAPPTCIVTDSAIARGMTTALSWFNPKIKAVSPERMKEAFDYLEIPREHEERVWSEIWRLRAELPNVKMKGVARPKS